MFKGISPLIATVLLIAVTMAIAGVMASWATQFSAGKVAKANQDAECIGALDISSLKFDNETIYMKIRNIGNINLTNMKADIEYGDPSKSRANVVLKDYNVTDPLAPGYTSFLTYPTNDATTPDKISVTSENCNNYPASLVFT